MIIMKQSEKFINIFLVQNIYLILSGHVKMISVSKEIIRKTPVETYQKILDILKDYENKEPTTYL